MRTSDQIQLTGVFIALAAYLVSAQTAVNVVNCVQNRPVMDMNMGQFMVSPFPPTPWGTGGVAQQNSWTWQALALDEQINANGQIPAYVAVYLQAPGVGGGQCYQLFPASTQVPRLPFGPGLGIEFQTTTLLSAQSEGNCDGQNGRNPVSSYAYQFQFIDQSYTLLGCVQTTTFFATGDTGPQIPANRPNTTVTPPLPPAP